MARQRRPALSCFESVARNQAMAVAEAAGRAASARADSLDSVNPAFTGCSGDHGAPIMDSSCFRASAAGDFHAGLGWGDDAKDQILRARG